MMENTTKLKIYSIVNSIIGNAFGDDKETALLIGNKIANSFYKETANFFEYLNEMHKIKTKDINVNYNISNSTFNEKFNVSTTILDEEELVKFSNVSTIAGFYLKDFQANVFVNLVPAYLISGAELVFSPKLLNKIVEQRTSSINRFFDVTGEIKENEIKNINISLNEEFVGVCMLLTSKGTIDINGHLDCEFKINICI